MTEVSSQIVIPPAAQGAKNVSGMFWATKRIFDILLALVAMPLVVAVAVVLLVLNPFFNSGPLLYRQIRMGRHCRPFWAIKFRSMRKGNATRGPDDPIERDRITALGAVLRRTRLDELPQFINVMRGDMSVIGPRPDHFSHAKHYVWRIPEYRSRHDVRPGISGLAQVSLGYSEGIEATRAKARADVDYIARAGLALEAWILWRTLVVVLLARGS